MKSQPDLLLLDVMMPGMDLKCADRCHEQNQADTGDFHYGFESMIQLKLEDDFLSKPFDRLELAARVKSLVSQKRLNEDLDHAEQVLSQLPGRLKVVIPTLATTVNG